MMTRKKSDHCSKKQVTQYTACVSNVVYKIPLSCGRVYIRQTGRRFNERAREHNLAVRNKSGVHLAVHCMRCECKPLLELTTFIKRTSNKTEREIIEAYFINTSGDNCVSQAFTE